jgi:hypothetical protein
VEIQGVEILTLIGGLCFVGFVNPIGVVAGVRRLAFIYWAHMNRFHLKAETESYLQNIF